MSHFIASALCGGFVVDIFEVFKRETLTHRYGGIR
jgi:hypothetical protein